MPATAPRILVIRRRYLGDIVLLGAFFRNLRLHWPDAAITLLAEAPYMEVAALQPDVAATLALPRSGRAVGAWYRLIAALRRGRFTHVFDLDNRTKTALLARLTGAPERIALFHEAPPRLPACYTRLVVDPPADHERRSIADYYLQALAGAGVPVVTREVRLVPREPDLAFARRLAPGSGPRLLVHPGSRSAFRLWPAENFAAVCDRVHAELGVAVTLVGGPAEQPFLAAIAQHARSRIFRIDTPLSVPQFAALAAQFEALLCHDSGPMHIAAAVGTPVIALFGSQNAALWRPPGAAHTVLQAGQPCGAACVAPGECNPRDSYRSYCVRRIAVDDVFAAVRSRVTAASPRR